MRMSTSSLRNALGRAWLLARTRVARDASSLLAGYATRVVLQAFGFVLIARALGAADLGAFAAVIALATLLSPFVELGAYSLAVRDITSGRSERAVIGTTLALTFVALPFALAVLHIVRMLAFPNIGSVTTVALGIGTFLGARLTSLFKGVSVARGEVAAAATIEAMTGVLYAAGAATIFASHGSLETWSFVYCGQSLAVGGGGLAILLRRFGRPNWTLGDVALRVREGIHFGIGTLAQNANTEFDKALLARLSTFESAGIYSASQRVVAVAIVPAMALFGAVYRRFFKSGPNALAESRGFARKLLPHAALYGVLASLSLLVAAPLTTRLFGGEFGGTVSAVRWLAPLVTIQVLSYPFLDALTGSGLQSVRTIAQVGAVSLGVILNLALDESFGWRGAAIASLVSQFALLVFCAVGSPVVATLLERRRRGIGHREAPTS